MAGKEAKVIGEGGGGEEGYKGKNGDCVVVGVGVVVVVVVGTGVEEMVVVGMMDDEGYLGFCFEVEGEGEGEG